MLIHKALFRGVLWTPAQISLEDLIPMKIPSLRGRGSENNKRILHCIALNGPMLVYDVLKYVEIKDYSTV